ncbi:MAG: SMI1/KNR4 family protein [Melioribacteraceae bacterium]|nr:SMI1/KNR4 family protein [Melioribacteraceae bacterium]MCF8355928.1 SMI1/KNR4 family protein [Melioribacteraceae bacterium]MCF8395468.1 SMI1/KNR4 family protein [Melioribacteraceae bacterium]MCF8420778.1 SMI1/KNR4 family protein [Melioribacteraceae bacterium]
MKIDKLLEELESFINDNPKTTSFSEPALREDITALEDELDINLPESYISFLLKHNGGFISLFPSKELTPDNIDTYEWNSNALLGIDDIRNEFFRMRYKFEDIEEMVAFVPFCHTKDQELLVFVTPLNEENESNIFDAWHEAGCMEWLNQKVYDGFEELLESYISNAGRITTIG